MGALAEYVSASQILALEESPREVEIWDVQEAHWVT